MKTNQRIEGFRLSYAGCLGIEKQIMSINTAVLNILC